MHSSTPRRLALVALLLATAAGASWQFAPARALPVGPGPAPVPVVPSAPKIDVAFVLDATGSMAGLIEGAKRKIWSLAGALAEGQPAPHVRIALVAYRDRGDAFVTRRVELTDDFDRVFAELTQLHAEGGGDGPESVNQALHEAVEQLDWRAGQDVYRAVFLVGDAPPHMDYANEVRWPESVRAARARGIVINTVQCGSLGSTAEVWQSIARQGAGEFAAIAQDGAMLALHAPVDDEIAALNRELAATVVPWGSAEEQAELETKASRAASAPPEAAAARLSYLAKTNKGERVNLGRRDLVEALDAGDVALGELPAEELPASLRALGQAEREGFVDALRSKRRALQARVQELVVERDAWVAQEERRRADAGEAEGFDARVRDTVRKQAGEAGITFE